jgi:hypothetical protein
MENVRLLWQFVDVLWLFIFPCRILRGQAERDWVDHVNLRAKETLYPMTESYYVGAEIPGKPRVFMPYSGGVRAYRWTLERVAEGGYQGFLLSRASASLSAPLI